MTKITALQVVAAIEEMAPLHYQATYDNAGFCIGDPQTEATGALLCVDVTEDILDEAIQVGANLIISHHPLLFKGLKRITGKTYTERIVAKAIKNDLVVYAAHTNMDCVRGGVSEKMGEKLQLQHMAILSPKANEYLKLVTFVPHAHEAVLREALFAAGAGTIGKYTHCSWNTSGKGTFMAQEGASPYVGKKGTVYVEPETRIEVILPKTCLSNVLSRLKEIHPYEEPAFDIIPLENTCSDTGFGIIGDLPATVTADQFLQQVKSCFGIPCIRYSNPPEGLLKRIAVCGGSGAFLLQEAMQARATAFISADFKYHDFFDAENRLMILDIGHYESERDVIDVFYDCLTKKMPTFAVHLTKITTNAINYFI